MTRGSRLGQRLAQEIETITSRLIETGLADDQNWPTTQLLPDGVHRVHYSSAAPLSALLKDIPYRDAYAEQLELRGYNLRLLDGAMVQMSYDFDASGALLRHRLAYLPSPDLGDFQSDPDLYLQETPWYAEVVEKRVVVVPLRFDFDNRDDVAKDLEHPVSHLTLGQYSKCRIAATGGLTPGHFMDFVLRSFYSTGANEFGDLVALGDVFPSTITPLESALLHIGVPVA